VAAYVEEAAMETIERHARIVDRGLPPPTPPESEQAETMQRSLPTAFLLCGILSPAVYIAADIVASRRYPGFSYGDQAVSELFAIGAPTTDLVVPLFTLSSGLLLAFGLGVWSFANRRAERLLAVAFAFSAINALVLWNFFPMHMRGEPRSITDTMHLVLATNPFVLLSLVCAAVAVGGWFRVYTIATTAAIIGLAMFAFSYAPAIDANGPTPWMGLTERIGQYGYGVWQALLAVMLSVLPTVTPPRSSTAA
jgi:fumarate reductase subunit D